MTGGRASSIGREHHQPPVKTPSTTPIFFEPLEARIAPATLTVTNLDDAGEGSLRDAIIKANATSAPDTIVFAPGIVSDGATITLTSGTLDIFSPITIKGPGLDKMTIDGNANSRIFRIDDGTANNIKVNISGLTLTNGSTISNGGAIYNTEALKLDRVAIVGNESTSGDGGGIYSYVVGKAQVSFTNSIVQGNSALWTGGGGLFGMENGGKLLIKNVTFADNSADGAGGLSLKGFAGQSSVTLQLESSVLSGNTATTDAGGLEVRLDSNQGAAKAFIKDTRIVANSAASYGGVYTRLDFGSTSLKVINTTVSENQATGSYGGWGIAQSGQIGKVEFINSNFTGNNSSVNAGNLGISGAGSQVSLKATTIENGYASFGGGLFLAGGAQATLLSNSSVIGNVSGSSGGGIFVTDSTLLMTSGQISGNSTTSNGGGLLVEGSDSLVTLNKVTISGNAANGSGGGISADTGSTTTINQSTILGNRAASVGGGISAVDVQSFKLLGSRLESNQSFASAGGAYLSGTGTFEFLKTRVLGNHADNSSGGILANGSVGSTFRLENSLIQGNVAQSGYGGGLTFANGMTHSVLNTIIEANIAATQGGGLYVSNSGGSSAFTGGRISGNSAGTSGGGLYNGGMVSVELNKTPITGNFAPASTNIFGPVSM